MSDDNNVIILSSGIKCIHKRVKSAALHCGMTINAGTRDEGKAEHGVAHLIEHLLFKGTTKRKPFHINSLLDNGGGELNAFTTKEETVIHTASLKGDFTKAVDLISDIIFNSTFPAAELEKEKSVIIDEINSYKDSPSDLIFDDFEDMLFAGSSLGRNILGNKQSLSKFSAIDLRKFISRCYNTDNMVFSVVGDVSFSRFSSICELYFGSITPNLRGFERELPPDYKPFFNEVNKRTYQTHCILGARAYSHDSKNRVALALLMNLLGGTSANSRLNIALRERNGLAYSVEAGYTAYYDTGVASIYFGTDKENLDKATKLVNNELCKLKDAQLSASELARVKRQLLGQLLLSSDSNENNMLSAGKSILVYNKVDTIESLTEKVNAITAAQLCDVANEIFRDDNISTLIYK